MEWPYDHPRRGEMPPGHHALSLNEYTIRQPPYAADSQVSRRSTPTCRAGAAPTTEEHRRQREGSPVHRHQLRVGPRAAARRQDEHLGPAGAAPLGLRLQGEDPRRLRRGLADLLRRHRAVLRPVDLYLGISGVKENLPHLPDSIFQRPTRLDAAEVHAAQVAEEDGPRADAVSRRRHDRRPEAQQVSQPLLRPRRVQPARRRLRHPRRVRFADRPDLSGDGHRQSDASHQRHRARDSRRSEDRQGARRRRSSTRRPDRLYEAQGEGRRARRVDARVGAAAAAVEVARRIRTASATRAATSATTSASTSWGRASPGWSRICVGKPRTLDDGRPGGFYVPRFRNLTDKQSDFIRGYGFEGAAGTRMFPATRTTRRASARRTRRRCATTPAPTSAWAAFGEVLAALREPGRARSRT